MNTFHTAEEMYDIQSIKAKQEDMTTALTSP